MSALTRHTTGPAHRSPVRAFVALAMALLLALFQHVAFAHSHAPDRDAVAQPGFQSGLWDYAGPRPVVDHSGHDHEDGPDPGPDPDHRACQLCILSLSEDEEDAATDAVDDMPVLAVLSDKLSTLRAEDFALANRSAVAPSAPRRAFARAPPRHL